MNRGGSMTSKQSARNTPQHTQEFYRYKDATVRRIARNAQEEAMNNKNNGMNGSFGNNMMIQGRSHNPSTLNAS